MERLQCSKALANYLKEEYLVVSLDFQKMSYANFENEQAFVVAFAGELIDNVESMPEEIYERLNAFAVRACAESDAPVIISGDKQMVRAVRKENRTND